MDIEQYLQMCEQMGWEPKEEELPRIASGKTAKKQMREEAIKELGLES